MWGRRSTVRGRAARRGFTLIECVGATVLISLAVPPTLVALHDLAVRRSGPIMASRARWLAGERLEDVIADRHSAARGYGWISDSAYADESPVAGMAGFSRSVTIVETGPDLETRSAGYKTITVTVSWNDPLVGPTSLSLAAVVVSYE